MGRPKGSKNKTTLIKEQQTQTFTHIDRVTELEQEVSELKQLLVQALADKAKAFEAGKMVDAHHTELPAPHQYSATSMRKYIKVINLFDGILNLSTEPLGRGKLYSFDKFGYDQKIPDNILADIVANDTNKFKQGYCYIDDPAFVHEVGLAEDYKKILTLDEVKAILMTTDPDEAEHLFKKASPAQKDVVISLLVKNALIDQESTNELVVSRISRITNIDIALKIEEARSYKEIFEEDMKAHR